MELPSYFETFMGNIRLTPEQKTELQAEHLLLRSRLNEWEDLKPIIISDFLQGSYVRATIIRPTPSDRADVDIVVVTNLDKDYPDPSEAMELFTPFLEHHYKGQYSRQGRSFKIERGRVKMDLVITAAPDPNEQTIYRSAALTAGYTIEDGEDWVLKYSWQPSQQQSLDQHAYLTRLASEQEWQTSPLWIPDREAKTWGRTHPIAQIKATRKKNALCNGHYVNVVKAIKKWRRLWYEQGALPKYPKGYPLEHITWTTCTDNTPSLAQGVSTAFTNISIRYTTKPFLADHGVPEHDVLKRISDSDFTAFRAAAIQAADIAERAIKSEDKDESVKLWQSLFGAEFTSPTGDGTGPFKQPVAPGTGDSNVRRFGYA